MKKTIKQIKMEQTRLRYRQNPSVSDKKIEKRKQILRKEYLSRIKNNQI